MKPKQPADAELDEADQLSDQDAELRRIRWVLRYVRPRTPAERAALLEQVKDRVRSLTPEQKAACDGRRTRAREALEQMRRAALLQELDHQNATMN